MKEIINIGGRDEYFKASAATVILYRQLFKTDLLKDIGGASKKENDIDKANDATDAIQQLAFIMWCEGNYKDDEIFQNLTLNKYIAWLLQIDPFELTRAGKKIIALWRGNFKSNSEIKNV